MNILITGLGVSGKSTFRRKLVALFHANGVPFWQYDKDQFDVVRDPLDAVDQIEDRSMMIAMLTGPQTERTARRIKVVEDVHATMKSALVPLSAYNFVFYIEADPLAYVKFWLDRAKRWYENGQFSWKPGRGWLGTGKPNDPRNLIPIAKEFARACAKREEWLQEDLRALFGGPFILVRVKSHWNQEGPPTFTIDF